MALSRRRILFIEAAEAIRKKGRFKVAEPNLDIAAVEEPSLIS